MNNVQIIGRLTSAPELKILTNTTVCNFSIAINEKYNGAEKVSYFNCVAFGKTADAIEAYVSKGHRIAVTGKLQQDRWTDSTTQTNRSVVKIIVNSVDFLQPKDTNTSAGPSSKQEQTNAQQQVPAQTSTNNQTQKNEPSQIPEEQAEFAFAGQPEEEAPF